MWIRLTGDRTNHRILGAQIIGRVSSEVSKRIDIFAAAIFSELNVEDLNNVDLFDTPTLSSAYDPIQMGAQVVDQEMPSALANLWEFFWSENDFLLTKNSTRWYVQSVCTIFRHR